MTEYKLNNFKLGLCGTHRTGKTTLASHVAERLELPFVQTQASSVFKSHKLQHNKPITPLVRLAVQTDIMALSLEQWDKYSAFVTDRTPLDFISYLLMDYDPILMNEELEARYADYIDHCFDMANNVFTSVVLVPKGIPMVQEEWKGCLSPVYLGKQETIIRGLMTDPRLDVSKYTIDGNELDLDLRGDAVIRTILKNFRKAKEIISEQAVH